MLRWAIVSYRRTTTTGWKLGKGEWKGSWGRWGLVLLSRGPHPSRFRWLCGSGFVNLRPIAFFQCTPQAKKRHIGPAPTSLHSAYCTESLPVVVHILPHLLGGPSLGCWHAPCTPGCTSFCWFTASSVYFCLCFCFLLSNVHYIFLWLLLLLPLQQHCIIDVENSHFSTLDVGSLPGAATFRTCLVLWEQPNLIIFVSLILYSICVKCYCEPNISTSVILVLFKSTVCPRKTLCYCIL